MPEAQISALDALRVGDIPGEWGLHALDGVGVRSEQLLAIVATLHRFDATVGVLLHFSPGRFRDLGHQPDGAT